MAGARLVEFDSRCFAGRNLGGQTGTDAVREAAASDLTFHQADGHSAKRLRSFGRAIAHQGGVVSKYDCVVKTLIQRSAISSCGGMVVGGREVGGGGAGCVFAGSQKVAYLQ